MNALKLQADVLARLRAHGLDVDVEILDDCADAVSVTVGEYEIVRFREEDLSQSFKRYGLYRLTTIHEENIQDTEQLLTSEYLSEVINELIAYEGVGNEDRKSGVV